MPSTIKTVWPDATSLATAAAHLIVNISNKAVAQKGYFTLALSGGSTPRSLFEILAQPPFVHNIPWKQTIIAFGDERFVPHSSDESNFKMAKETLLTKVPLLKKNIHGIPTSKVTPQQSADAYEATIKTFISNKNPFDLVLLGIGEEGHTASIFPGSSLLQPTKRWIQQVWVPEKNMDRISFTLSFINKAGNVAFLVSGAAKAAIVKTIFAAKGASLPAAQVKASGTTYWMLDNAAVAVQ